MQAIWVILVANLTTSTDNVLAVAGASNGNIYLLIFSLGLSIPIIIFSANLLSMLMDRYPIIIYVGAAVLGTRGGRYDFFRCRRSQVAAALRLV